MESKWKSKETPKESIWITGCSTQMYTTIKLHPWLPVMVVVVVSKSKRLLSRCWINLPISSTHTHTHTRANSPQRDSKVHNWEHRLNHVPRCKTQMLTAWNANKFDNINEWKMKWVCGWADSREKDAELTDERRPDGWLCRWTNGRMNGRGRGHHSKCDYGTHNPKDKFSQVLKHTSYGLLRFRSIH